MSVTINIYENFTVTLGSGNVVSGGSRTTPKTITVDGDVHEARRVLASATDEAILWDANVAGDITDFDFLWFETDKDCYLELSVASETWTIKVNANTPLVMGADDADVELSQGGTLTIPSDLIDYIRVESISSDTTVRLVLMT